MLGHAAVAILVLIRCTVATPILSFLAVALMLVPWVNSLRARRTVLSLLPVSSEIVSLESIARIVVALTWLIPDRRIEKLPE